MTAGKLPDNLTDGFKQWIDYAFQSNPNIPVFLSMPPPDFPEDWEELAQNLEFNSIQETYASFIPPSKLPPKVKRSGVGNTSDTKLSEQQRIIARTEINNNTG